MLMIAKCSLITCQSEEKKKNNVCNRNHYAKALLIVGKKQKHHFSCCFFLNKNLVRILFYLKEKSLKNVQEDLKIKYQ